MPTKELLRLGLYSLTSMACGEVVITAFLNIEAIPASLLAVLCMAPATILYLVAAKFQRGSRFIKHGAYFIYYLLWVAYCALAYTAGDGNDAGLVREIARAIFLFISIAAFFGYVPLVWQRRFSLRAMLLLTTAAAILMAIIGLVVRRI